MSLLYALLILLAFWLGLHLALRRRGKGDVVAHRGAAAVAPENTLPSVEAGMKSGALYLEIDVQRSKDGSLVVIHDTTVDRTTDGSGKVGDLTLRELKELDAGAWFEPKFAGAQIPSLEEVFTKLGSWPGALVIEAKSPSAYPGIEKDIAGAIWRTGFPRITIVSFDHAWLQKFREVNPDIPLGALSVLPPLRMADTSTERIGVHWSAPLLDPTLVRRTHNNGQEIWVWTVDKPWLQRLLRWLGVDGITANDPASAVKRL